MKVQVDTLGGYHYRGELKRGKGVKFDTITKDIFNEPVVNIEICKDGKQIPCIINIKQVVSIFPLED